MLSAIVIVSDDVLFTQMRIGGKLVRFVIHQPSLITASTSISTNHSGLMNLLTSTTVSTGRISLKYSPRTFATCSQSSILVSSMRVRTTSSNDAPASSNAALIVSKHCRVCAAGSFSKRPIRAIASCSN